MFTQPFGRQIAFIINRKIFVTAAGKNDDRSTIGIFFRRQVRNKRWKMNARHAANSVGSDRRDFRRSLPFGSWRTAWPEANFGSRV